jgi:hypothetical protein
LFFWPPPFFSAVFVFIYHCFRRIRWPRTTKLEFIDLINYQTNSDISFINYVVFVVTRLTNKESTLLIPFRLMKYIEIHYGLKKPLYITPPFLFFDLSFILSLFYLGRLDILCSVNPKQFGISLLNWNSKNWKWKYISMQFIFSIVLYSFLNIYIDNIVLNKYNSS